MQSVYSRKRRLLAALALTVGTAGAAGVALASDHQDTPEVELNPSMDMTDVYAFPGAQSGRIVLVMMSHPFLTPADAANATFDSNLLYQFKIDTDGDAKEDKVIQVTFSGTGANQKVSVRGPIAPPVVGAMQNQLAGASPSVSGAINTTLGSATTMQVFAGPRDDPFFLDLEQFFRILPDRKPATGDLSNLPDAPSASAFRPAGAAVNYLAGFNGLALVIELPVADLVTGGKKLGIWGTISR